MVLAEHTLEHTLEHTPEHMPEDLEYLPGASICYGVLHIDFGRGAGSERQ